MMAQDRDAADLIFAADMARVVRMSRAPHPAAPLGTARRLLECYTRLGAEGVAALEAEDLDELLAWARDIAGPVAARAR